MTHPRPVTGTLPIKSLVATCVSLRRMYVCVCVFESSESALIKGAKHLKVTEL